MRARHSVVLLALWIFSLGSIHAQHVQVEGTVLLKDGSAVDGAAVTIQPVTSGRSVLSVKTHADGGFKLPFVEFGTYQVHVAKSGLVMRTWSIQARLPNNQVEYEDRGAVGPDGTTPELKLEPGRRVRIDLVLGPPESPAVVASPSPGGGAGDLAEANRLTAEGRHPQALGLLQGMLERGEDGGPVLYLMGINQAKLGGSEKALELFRRAVDRDPSLAGVRAQIAALLHEKGDKAGAADWFAKEQQRDPTLFPVALNLAVVLTELGRREEAVDAWKRVIELAPSEAGAYKELAGLYTDLGRPAEAAEILRRLEQVGKPDPAYWFNLGAQLSNEDKFDHAEEAYRKALSLDPDFAPAHREFGYLLLRKGETSAALALLKRYLQIAAGAEDAADVRATVKELEAAAR